MLRLRDKLNLVPPLAALSLLLLMAGCNQDAIFDYISGETAPTEAKIKGAPSRIVEATIGGVKKLYIANGRLWEYAPAESGSHWQRVSGPGGFVADVASASGSVYALTVDNTTTGVWRYDGTGWEELAAPGSYGFIQNIFGAGDALFATGARRAGSGYEYQILYYDQSGWKELGNAFLSGAGHVKDNNNNNKYYLATRGNGIYEVSFGASDFTIVPVTTATATSGPIPSDVAGLLQAGENYIIGVGTDGHILKIDFSSLEVADTSLGGAYTGALALMDIPQQTDGSKLLLLGYKNKSSSTSYTHGYMELQFNGANTLPRGTARVPGSAQPSSVSDYRQYDSSLRRHPVTALWALQPENGAPPVVFAATSNDGLYSYRDRSDGGWQWNHEE